MPLKFNIVNRLPPKQKKMPKFNIINRLPTKEDTLFKTMTDMAGTNMTHANQPSVGGFGTVSEFLSSAGIYEENDTHEVDYLDERELEIYDLVPDDEDSYWLDSMIYDDDFTEVITEKESRWYVKARQKDFREMSRKDQDKREAIEEKLMGGIGHLLGKQHTKVFNIWKGANKGRTEDMKKLRDSFRDFYESY